jgi:uncharacterized protein
MTPQERDLIAELFDRLSTLENAPRDAAAERAIAEDLARAPNAIYPLVQTVLVQDEALKRANARIQELEGTGGESPGFLDSMRSALFGRDAAPRGSVPSIKADAGNATSPPGGVTAGTYGAGPYEQMPGGTAPGGSFLGTAAATAAGVVGGSLLLDSFRSMFGHGHASAGAYEPMRHSPWDSGSSASGSDLAREAGLDDIGRHGSGGGGHDHESAGLIDTADNADGFDGDFDDGDFDGDDIA